MRIVALLILAICLCLISDPIHAESWTGSGSHSDPYIYVSDTQPNGYGIYVVRGQTILNNTLGPFGGVQTTLGSSSQVSYQYDFFEVQGPGAPGGAIYFYSNHTGEDNSVSEIREDTLVVDLPWYQEWVMTSASHGKINKILTPVADPANPGVNWIGMWFQDSLDLTLSQDSQQMSGNVTIDANYGQVTPSEEVVFCTFGFDFNADTWNFGINRDLNGVNDLNEAQSGSWDPYYNNGTTITLPAPTVEDGRETDWLLWVSDAYEMYDYMGTYYYPFFFEFDAYTEAYLLEYKPTSGSSA